MSHGLKLLLLAAGTLITCLVCAISFSWTGNGRTQAMRETQRIQAAYAYEKLEDYDGISIDGAALIDLMQDYEDEEVFFLVKTKGCIATQGVFYHRDDCNHVVGQYNKSTSFLHEDYINPSAIFLCEVRQNANGVIVGVRFVQQ